MGSLFCLLGVPGRIELAPYGQGSPRTGRRCARHCRCRLALQSAAIPPSSKISTGCLGLVPEPKVFWWPVPGLDGGKIYLVHCRRFRRRVAVARGWRIPSTERAPARRRPPRRHTLGTTPRAPCQDNRRIVVSSLRWSKDFLHGPMVPGLLLQHHPSGMRPHDVGVPFYPELALDQLLELFRQTFLGLGVPMHVHEQGSEQAPFRSRTGLNTLTYRYSKALVASLSSKSIWFSVLDLVAVKMDQPAAGQASRPGGGHDARGRAWRHSRCATAP